MTQLWIARAARTVARFDGEHERLKDFGTTAVVKGVQRARAATEGGGEAESVSAFTDVFVRQSGRWRLALAYGVELPTGGEPKQTEER